MRSRTIFASLLLSFLSPAIASPKAAPVGDLHVFYGLVKSVDLAAHTFTIESGHKSFLFHYTKETKISSYNGYVRWDTVKPGRGATVVMRVGEGGAGVAVNVRFEVDSGRAESLALFSARTVRGENVSGIAVSNFVAYEPPSGRFNRGIKFGFRSGLFEVVVRPNGTVATARPLKSLGFSDLDKIAIEWLKQWRFRQNSVTKVRIPVSSRQDY